MNKIISVSNLYENVVDLFSKLSTPSATDEKWLQSIINHHRSGKFLDGFNTMTDRGVDSLAHESRPFYEAVLRYIQFAQQAQGRKNLDFFRKAKPSGVK